MEEMLDKGSVHELINANSESFSFEALIEQIREYRDVDESTGNRGCWVVMDDILTKLDAHFQNLFSVHCSKNFTSLYVLTQKLFYSNPVFRMLSQNCHYIVLFRDLRNGTASIENLARQSSLLPRNFLIEAYLRACNHVKYGYIVLDFHQESPDLGRVRTRLFADEFPVKLFCKV